MERGDKLNVRTGDTYEPVDPFNPSVVLSTRRLFASKLGIGERAGEIDLVSFPAKEKKETKKKAEYRRTRSPSIHRITRSRSSDRSHRSRRSPPQFPVQRPPRPPTVHLAPSVESEISILLPPAFSYNTPGATLPEQPVWQRPHSRSNSSPDIGDTPSRNSVHSIPQPVIESKASGSRSSSKSRSSRVTPSIISRHSVLDESPLVSANAGQPLSRSSNHGSFKVGSEHHSRAAPSLQLPNHAEHTLKQSSDLFLLKSGSYFLAFIFDTVPRQIYLHLLLRLPYLYYSRVTRIFEEAEIDIDVIKRGIFEDAWKQKEWLPTMKPVQGHNSSPDSRAYRGLGDTWVMFIDSLLKEWETLNIISALLLTAILTVLQLDGAGTDPITRFSALISMMCALISLLFGCMYIIRFGMMRKIYKAAELAAEAKKTDIGIFWNVWVMLAMPAIWLGWSMICFLVCIMSFVWRTGAATDGDHEPSSDSRILAPRIMLSMVLALGLVYFALIVKTLRRYGAPMDRLWQSRIRDWVSQHGEAWGGVSNQSTNDTDQTSSANKGSRRGRAFPPRRPTVYPGVVQYNVEYHRPSPIFHVQPPLSMPPFYHLPVQFDATPPLTPTRYLADDADAPLIMGIDDVRSRSLNHIKGLSTIYVTRMIGLSKLVDDGTLPPLESDLRPMGMDLETWRSLHDSARECFKTSPEPWTTNQGHNIFSFIAIWNETHFRARDGQIRLCEEQKDPMDSNDEYRERNFALYYFSTAEELPFDASRYELSNVKDSAQPRMDHNRVDVLGAFGRVSEDDGDGEWKLLSLSVTGSRIPSSASGAEEVLDVNTKQDEEGDKCSDISGHPAGVILGEDTLDK